MENYKFPDEVDDVKDEGKPTEEVESKGKPVEEDNKIEIEGVELQNQVLLIKLKKTN